MVNAISKINYTKLDKAIITGQPEDLIAAVSTSGVRQRTAEYTAMIEALGPKNSPKIQKIMQHLRGNLFVVGIPSDKMAGMTLNDILEYVVKKENEYR